MTPEQCAALPWTKLITKMDDGWLEITVAGLHPDVGVFWIPGDADVEQETRDMLTALFQSYARDGHPMPAPPNTGGVWGSALVVDWRAPGESNA